ncbi:MAG: hypothetical protein KA761_02010 [Gemmatimonadaceae bacterium]|nr:hypothetical protein [Gemmatimonadaceae bacterium]
MTPGDLLLRIRIDAPPSDVAWALQLGRTELSPPARRTPHLEFEVTVRVVDGTNGELDFRGAAVQGPRGGRFIYITSGTRAGQRGSPWDRRAKVSIEGLRQLLSKQSGELQAITAAVAFAGTARDGGPSCASVPLLGSGWTISPRKTI